MSIIEITDEDSILNDGFVLIKGSGGKIAYSKVIGDAPVMGVDSDGYSFRKRISWDIACEAEQATKALTFY